MLMLKLPLCLNPNDIPIWALKTMLRKILHTPILNFQTLALTLLLTRGTMLLHTLISVTPQENAPKRIRTLLSMVFMAMMYVHPGASLSHIVGTTQNNIFFDGWLCSNLSTRSLSPIQGSITGGHATGSTNHICWLYRLFHWSVISHSRIRQSSPSLHTVAKRRKIWMNLFINSESFLNTHLLITVNVTKSLQLPININRKIWLHYWAYALVAQLLVHLLIIRPTITKRFKCSIIFFHEESYVQSFGFGSLSFHVPSTNGKIWHLSFLCQTTLVHVQMMYLYRQHSLQRSLPHLILCLQIGC